jgi:hypothetical protein
VTAAQSSTATGSTGFVQMGRHEHGLLRRIAVEHVEEVSGFLDRPLRDV